MTNQTCRCGRTNPAGTSVCPRCLHTLNVALTNIAIYHADLDTLRTRRTRYGNGTATKGSIGKTQPLGVDLRFVTPSHAAGDDDNRDQVPGHEGTGTTLDRTTRASLLLWTARFLKHRSPLAGPTCLGGCLHTSCANIRRRARPTTTVPSMCAYLHKQQRIIAAAPWGGQLVDDIVHLERNLARFVDRPADRWYAGKCSAPLDDGGLCERELYARTDTGTLRCKVCGTEHDIAARRDFLLDEAKEYFVTATEAAGALLAWTDYDGSESKLVDLIRKWRDRDKLDVQDVTSLHGKDRHLYRLGDIQELLVQHAQREQEKRLRHVG